MTHPLQCSVGSPVKGQVRSHLGVLEFFDGINWQVVRIVKPNSSVPSTSSVPYAEDGGLIVKYPESYQPSKPKESSV